jgi:hypothetical protein
MNVKKLWRSWKSKRCDACDDDLMSIVESFLDTESEVFEFIWKPLPQGWGTFIKTIVIDCPSK